MTCPVCRSPIPDNALVCVVCFQRKSRSAALTREREYVPRILAGTIQLRLARSAQSTRSHLELVSLAGQSWCGEPLAMHWKRQHVDYDKQLEAQICIRCWKTLHGMTEATTA